MWQSLGPWLAGGGGVSIVGAVAWLLNRWHRDAIAAMREAVNSMRESRDAYRDIASYERQRADVREQQIGQVLGRASERL